MRLEMDVEIVEINVETCALCGNVWSRHEIDWDHVNILKCEGE